ncbi:YheU family protein [Fluoribacter gormanii]|uniref:YheU family protein n=1 Tax=Fluoribacter gormanii TaxID=464 RepID=UPI0013EF6423|nr:YheU family protein [Fluoribacter gormanii]
MIEIDSSLLSQSNLDALISKIIAQQTAHDETDTQNLDAEKLQLLQKIQQGILVIVYDAKDNSYDVISSEEFQNKCAL